jgi:septal ring factor EnvC (AmiA/AmiB activator)
MKKLVLTLCAATILSGFAYADGNAFTPLNFNDTTYGTPAAAKANSAVNTIPEAEATGNGNIQNAIQQLDNAQIDIRNELLNVKTKYADIDAQYKLIKTERATLKKQVRSVEKRIKEIDKAKENIRKIML